MDAFPTFTVEEAQAAIPTLKPLLARLREAFHAYKFAKEQADELVTLHGIDLASPQHPDFDEAQRWDIEREARSREVEGIISEINTLGADVKDPILGLVDFFAKRGNDVVLLCFRDDEDAIHFWHPIESGFAGRRPLDEL